VVEEHLLRQGRALAQAKQFEDLVFRLTKVAAEQAAARSRARRERDAAGSLLRTLRASRRPLEQDLEVGLECGDPQAIKAGFELLADNAARPAAAVDLAAGLQEDGATLTFAVMHALVRFAQVPAANTFSTGEIHPYVVAALGGAAGNTA
jgi:hypothetical protein